MHTYHSYFEANVYYENVTVYDNLIAYTSTSYVKICRRFQLQTANIIGIFYIDVVEFR